MQSVVTPRRMLLSIALMMVFFSRAQPGAEMAKKAIKPYRIFTTGKQVTVKSTKNIRNIMVWTSGGHRVIEQKDINASSCNLPLMWQAISFS